MGLANIFSQISSVKVRSITDTPFIMGVILVISAGFSSNICPPWLTIGIFGLGSILILTAVVVYIYFVIRKPDYLRSESYQLKKQSLEMLGDSENEFNPNSNAIAMIASSSPYQLQEENPKNLDDNG